jgi:hypothetical protein
MIRYLFFSSGLFVMMISMQSCFNEIVGISGSGQVKSENRNISGFMDVGLNIAGEVEITKDSLYRLEVSDYENLLPHIRTYVNGNMLIIEHEPDNLNVRNSVAKIKIKMPALNNIIVNGSGTIGILSGFDELSSINITGSGNINAIDSFNTTSLKVLISGSGNVSALGRANELTTNITGSGNMNLFGLIAQNATCVITGSGNTFVNIVQNLNATILGSGNIVYLGNPKLTVNVSGSGTVKSR